MKYRNLTAEEVSQLERQGCEASDWAAVTVSEQFKADNVRNVRFSGNVQLGAFNRVFTLEGGVPRHSGLRNVALHNVTIGDDCLVEDVHEYIANYDIANDCRISNVDIIVAPSDRTDAPDEDPKPRFGNGIEVTTVNEAGGREVTIHDRLSAQQAYIMAIYRYRPKTVERLKQVIKKYVATIDPNRGKIGEATVITDCGTIREVNIGSHATLHGAKRLTCGSINSNAKAPVSVGDGVIADEFIISSGSHVDEGALLTRCFVGQACHVGRGFSAVDSLFFSNCHMENGEACSLFAGPYTVSHHKSTLLIAGLFSFMNAGSGTNQSNHGYGLGPMYQGIMERGCKTASDSYVLWPAHIGAFTLVKGRHTCHPDTSNIPFSYILEESGKSYLVPGINLARIGSMRDSLKWPARDGRTDDDQLDILNFEMFNPYTMSACFRGFLALRDFVETCEKEKQGENEEAESDNAAYDYKGMLMRLSAAKRGKDNYVRAFNWYVGTKFYKRLQNTDCDSSDAVRKRLKGTGDVEAKEWSDLAGMIVPTEVVVSLMNDLDRGRIATLEALEKRFAEIKANYDEYEWNYVRHLIKLIWNKSLDKFSVYELSKIVTSYAFDSGLMKEEAMRKAETDFVNKKTKVDDIPPSYGIDHARESDIREDFINVNGDPKKNPVMQTLAKEVFEETLGIMKMMRRIKRMK
jgi:hypothetical protein